MIYTFHNPHYGGGIFKDFVSFEAKKLADAEREISIFNFGGSKYKLWSITKGISLKNYIQPCK